AGFGSRMRPHTWSRPKQLLRVANNTALGHVLETLSTVPDPNNVEFIFIIGYLGEQMKPYMDENYPQYKVHYIWQREMKGQSHAIYQCKDVLGGPMLMVFADTLIETNLGFLANETAGGVAWVKPVPDPRRFGVAEVGEDGWVKRLIEKPPTMENNLAVVGFYYFADSMELLSAIEEQMARNIQLKNEYFLADAVNIMLARGMKMKTVKVDTWLDTGTPDATLDTNHFLLDNGRDNSADASRAGVTIIPPVYIHPTARVEASVIGPYAAVGANVTVTGSVIRDSIIEDQAEISNSILDTSLIGKRAKVNGLTGNLNVGDDSVVKA
ncbi:MAG TPA: sugar phosphate nucleotidyltransferase, partial [Anaerolineales bacterium]|nr:sugar phosphate nucleotidyltransferase [Anaerolineales bacterium]